MKSGIVIIAALVINSLLRSLVKVPRQLDNRRGRTYKVVIKNAITLIVVFLVLYILFKIWNIDIAPLLASAGIIGIVVGIGSRSLFEDLLAGMFLVSQSRVAVGDYISIGNGVEGTVDSIGLKNTTLISGNGAYTVVPNGQIKQVTNNAYGKAQVVLEIPVKTGQHLDTVLKTIGDVIASFDDDQEFTLLKGTKIIGVNKIDVHGAFVVNVLLVAEGRLRGAIEPQFYYRLIKAFEKKKLAFV
ncbi:mechanosensitive ion channel family protein, partial [Candidatus Microgenomates bacterium]|nr:mechanosensitive ion channel family protein [Candidatus Microgenomates bacterium]